MKCPFSKVVCKDALWKIAWGYCKECHQASAFRDTHPRKIEKVIEHCPECGHLVAYHTDDGCHQPYSSGTCLCNCTFTGKCTAEWSEKNCLDKATCPTLSDGSICTHCNRTPTNLQPPPIDFEQAMKELYGATFVDVEAES